MKKEILCGSACVRYILNYYNINYNDLDYNMLWIPQLALELLKYNFNITVRCFNSNLYDDYKKIGKDNLDFDGFKYINELNKKGSYIEEKESNQEQILNEINLSKFIILCVKSDIFNDDMNFNSSHFIILNKIVNNLVEVINPVKDEYEIKYLSLDKIVKCCEKFGMWRIIIYESNCV